MGRPSFVAVDQFCGGGGTSTGLASVCRERSIDPRLYALNHWPVALATHARNHPWAIHVSEEIQRLDPLTVVREGHANLLVSSPTCTYFSNARGGKPTSDQLRSQPYEVVRWISALYPDAVLVENVPEFRQWGPVVDGLPDPARKGISFRQWVGRIKALGYNVDYRVLNAADYGGATSRRRFFLVARRGSAPIAWPVPTHSQRDKPMADRKPWRAAAEVIDWTLVGRSVWSLDRPLSYATWRRILVGLERYGGPEMHPFVAELKRQSGIAENDDKPRRQAQAFILPPLGVHARGGKANQPRSVEEPLHTLTSRGAQSRVVQPFLVRTNFNCYVTQGRMGAAPRPVYEPLPTVVGADRTHCLTEPFLVPVVGRRASEAVHPKSVSEPFPTFTGRTGIWLADAVIVPRHGEREGQASRAHPVTEPVPTITGTHTPLLARGFLVKYYGTGDNVESVDEPVPTITTKDRFMLVRPVVIDGRFLDIRTRMLQPHELAAGMGFPEEYVWVGNRTEVVKQIGNAVEVNIARALCAALLSTGPKVLDHYGG